MIPTRIVLEKTRTHLVLRVHARELPPTGTAIESVPFADGVAPKPKTVTRMTRDGIAYAKRFGIVFENKVA